VDLPVFLAWAFALTLALVFGSFLNVCIARLPQHRSVAWPASHCPRCTAPIRPLDNIPLLSWFVLRGHCRDCDQPISLRYPLVEACFAALVACCVARYDFSLHALAASGFCFLVLGLLVMDLETMLLPDAFTLPGLALGLIWAFAYSYAQRVPGASLRLPLLALAAAAIAAAGWALVLLLIRWSYYAVRRRQGLGLGDVKLVAMLAAWLGAARTGLTFFVAVLIAAVLGVSVALMHQSRRRSAASDAPTQEAAWSTVRLPLGAFLCGAALYSFFLGDKALAWYFSLWS
jgi:leader peptidase (prepilin peptidase)/N-methyltransferase